VKSCPSCGGGAVIPSAPGGLTLYLCSTCGWRGSDERCMVRGCGDYATGKCAECGRFVCDPHRASRKSRLCDTCFKRYRSTVAGPRRNPRYGQSRGDAWWNRTSEG